MGPGCSSSIATARSESPVLRTSVTQPTEDLLEGLQDSRLVVNDQYGSIHDHDLSDGGYFQQTPPDLTPAAMRSFAVALRANSSTIAGISATSTRTSVEAWQREHESVIRWEASVTAW